MKMLVTKIIRFGICLKSDMSLFSEKYVFAKKEPCGHAQPQKIGCRYQDDSNSEPNV